MSIFEMFELVEETVNNSPAMKMNEQAFLLTMCMMFDTYTSINGGASAELASTVSQLVGDVNGMLGPMQSC